MKVLRTVGDAVPAARERDSPVEDVPKVRGREEVWRVSFGRDDIVVCCVALADEEDEEEEEVVVVAVEARLQTMLEEEDEGWDACGVMGVASMAKAPKHNGGGSSRRRRRGRKRGRRGG